MGSQNTWGQKQDLKGRVWSQVPDIEDMRFMVSHEDLALHSWTFHAGVSYSKLPSLKGPTPKHSSESDSPDGW